MERQFSKNEDIFEACHQFLGEFYDPYISDVDAVVLAMYRASKELTKLREQKHKTNMITSMVHEFENSTNESVISLLKEKNTKLLMKIRKIIKYIGAGDN